MHAELTLSKGVTVCPRTVSVLMILAGIYGLPGPVRVKRLRGVATADDLVNRKFHRLGPNELWVTDITQHRTREEPSRPESRHTRQVADPPCRLFGGYACEPSVNWGVCR